MSRGREGRKARIFRRRQSHYSYERLAAVRALARIARRFSPLWLGLVAALPIMVSAVRAINDHWAPYGDRAVIALRSFDVLSSYSPEVGQYTQWSAVLHRPAFSPGPMLYWLLTIPAHISAAWALPAWITVFNVLCVIAIMFMARRRAGLWLMAATAIAIPLMCRSLPSETFHDIWNPSTALLPFLLACFTSWSVACGDLQLAPLLVLLLSFIVETHLTFVAPGVGLVVVASTGLWPARRGYNRQELRVWLGASAIVAVVCWAPPILDQLGGSGNLRALYAAVRAAQGSLGVGDGWHAAVRAFGIPPWWLGPPISDLARLGDVDHSPSLLSQLSLIVELAVLAGLLIGGLRKRRSDAALAAICLVLIMTLAASTASTPTQDNLYLTIGYTLWWGGPAGLFVWLGMGVLVIPRLQLRRGFAPERAGRTAGAVAFASVVVALLVALSQPSDQDRGEYRSFGAAARTAVSVEHHRGPVLVTASPSYPGSELQFELVYALRLHGTRVLVPSTDAAELGKQYSVGTLRTAAGLSVTYRRVPRTGATVISRVPVVSPSPVQPGFFMIASHRGGS